MAFSDDKPNRPSTDSVLYKIFGSIALRSVTCRSEGEPLSVAASIALHVAIGSALMLLPQERLPAPPAEESIAVQILTSAQVKPPRKSPPAVPAALPPPVVGKESSVPPGGPQSESTELLRPQSMMRAARLYSDEALNDPRSRKVREELKQLASGDRVIQLCNIEAMEQIHRWKAAFLPDFLMAYAMAGVRITENTVEVQGGAFRSKRRWYNVRFKCEVTPDLSKVAAFEFLVGEEIPRDQWAEHNLTPGEGQD
jgi:hypothetical protein